MEKYYKILEIHPNATEQEVKQAYRDMVKVWHPDRFAHDIRLRKKAEANLKKINDAYERIVDHLNNSHKRQQSQQYERTEKQEKRASQPPPQQPQQKPPRQTKPNKLHHLKKNWGWYLFLGLMILLGITENAWEHRVKTEDAGRDYRWRGYDKYALHDYTGAIQYYSKAIELNPKDAEAYYERGLAKEMLKDKRGALEDLSKAGELRDKDAYKEIQRIQKGD